MRFTVLSRATGRAVLSAVVGTALSSAPALAQAQQPEQAPTQPDKPFTDQDIGARDVALTPLSDLNLKKGEIPKLLLDAQERPYDLTGMRGCAQISAAVGGLDAVLGEDIDVAQARGQRIDPGRAAQAAVGSFIPFRGLIREISGANAQDRKVQAAIYAGTARRAFLKGVGLQRGCRYPARPATLRVLTAAEEQAEAARRSGN